jgi:DNA-binding transcriptional MerR regulator
MRTMTTTEFCDRTGLSPRKVTSWTMAGVLGDTRHGAYRRELTEEHVARANILKALLAKRIPFAELADRTDLTFGGARYVVYDGRHLRPCQDAAAAIAAVAKAKHRCCAVDLAAIRSAADTW